MTLDRALLARYLRQRAELGGPELFLDDLTAAELRLLLAEEPGSALAPPTSAAEAKAAVREMLAGPLPSPSSQLSALEREVAACARCRLHEMRTRTVFGEGSPTAQLVVVGEAPGQEEDRTGRPFVGPAGKLLDLLLMSAGFARGDVYICNVLKSRPPNNRNPLPDEVEACTPWLRRQLELIAPKVLLAVGKFAAQTLAASEESIGRLRGRIFAYQEIPLVVSYHPAFLLRSPHWTRTAWQDFQLARKVLDEQA